MNKWELLFVLCVFILGGIVTIISAYLVFIVGIPPLFDPQYFK